MKNSFSPQTLITIIGVLIIFAIAFTDKLDVALILPVLGGICLALGILGLVKAYGKNASDAPKEGTSARCLLQIILGGFIMMLGIVEIADLTLPQNFWNGVLIVIIVIAVLWMLIKNRGIFKK